MASSGTFNFSPEVAELVDEAFERCGIDPASLTVRHLRSARRSFDLLFRHWSNFDINEWAVDQQTEAMTVGKKSFSLPAGTVDILSMTLKRDDVETEMYAISRADYHALYDKDIQGRPDRFWVHREVSPTCYFWQAGENTTDQLIYWRLRHIHDAGTPSNTLDLPPRMWEAAAAGLAARLAVKYAPGRLRDLEAVYQRYFDEALTGDRDRSPTIVHPVYGRRR